MKKKISMIIVIVFLIIVFIFIKNGIEKNKKHTNTGENNSYNIVEIMESDLIFSIDENYYGSDIDLYSSKDENGNEWIYKRTSNHIVLTEDGILCKYTIGSYREEIKYSGYKIIKTINLSKEQVKELTNEINKLDSIEFNIMEGMTEYTISQKDDSKTVNIEELNKVLKKYGCNMQE